MALPKNLLLNSKGLLAIGTISCLLSLPVNAATFGHARLDNTAVSGLDVRIPINNLTAADINVLAASAAPASQWQANGLNPPVDLNSLRFNILSTDKSGSSVLQVISDQAYQDSIIDLLLNITTASGIEPYQVSLIVPPSAKSSQIQSTKSAQKDVVGTIAKTKAKSINVRSGDNMFAIAKRNAVDGVSVYQLMMALQRTNPQAFIKNNVNLVKAGASLVMPSIDEMLSMSDAQARREFMAHTNALTGVSGNNISDAAVGSANDASNSGTVSSSDSTNNISADETIDRVKLDSISDSDAKVAQQHALADAKVRVSQLEDNVKNLNQALQSQGRAASDIVADGAKAISDSISQLSDSIVGDEDTDQQNTYTQTNNVSEATSQSAANNALSNAASSSLEDRDSINVDVATTNTSNTGADSLSGANSEANLESSDSTHNAAGREDTTSSNASQKTSNGDSAANNLKQTGNNLSWVNWANEHIMGVITAALALLVLIIVWILRRINTKRDSNLEPLVTDDMLQEKLNAIDLNLDSDNKKQQ